MASAMEKKNNTRKNHMNDPDWNEYTNASASLTEEKRLLKTERHSNQASNGGQISQKAQSKLNRLVGQMTSEQIDEELQKWQLPTSGNIEIRRRRLKTHKAERTGGRQSRDNEQNFEYIAVIDFEATCEDRAQNYPHEIIEFPIVLIDVQKQTIIDKFQSYCRPVKNPKLSSFCTQLTGIEQHQVDSAPLFVEVLHNVEAWLKQRGLLSSSDKHRLAFATDGPWDFAQFLEMQCRFSSISYPSWATRWVNIRKLFANFYVVPRSGVNQMLKQLGLRFDGRPHSGIDDATNIARIAIELLKDGCILWLNDGLDRTQATMFDSKTEITSGDDKEEQIVFFK